MALFSKSKTGKPYINLQGVSLWYERTSNFSVFSNRHLRKTKNFLALKNITFSIHEDETVGIIGRNGSGKSTISRVMCHVLQPNEGKVETHGKIQLLALGVGFNQKLTGRDNVYISGALLGLSKKEITEKIEDIQEFAELDDFFDEPVKTYSSGMKSRLGFAVSTAVNPDILILDEVFSTGDQSFKNRAKIRMDEMRSRTRIVIIISHNPNQVKKMCSRVIWLDRGQIVMDGDPGEILQHYEAFCEKPKQWILNNPDKYTIPHKLSA